ncbi:MAG TPA: hypothetical protein GX747_03445, partial [Tenericutes bacterium]|nr:hypothetical protein [Mycoplasmatota bacterium]
MIKNKVYILIVVLSIIVILFFIFLTKTNNGEKYISDHVFLYDVAIDYLKEEKYQSNEPSSEKPFYNFFITYDKFGITKNKNYKYAYMWVLANTYYIENGEKIEDSGYSMFFKFTFKDDKVIKYEIPEDGSNYVDSIKKMCIDKRMCNKIINYNSKLSNEEKINEYYSKVTDPTKLNKKDIISNDDLLFSISWRKTDCIPVNLNIYDNNKYVLYTAFEACNMGENCNSLLNYTKSEAGTYSYDVMKIIHNSIIADNMTFTNDNLPEYEIYTGKGE